MTRYVPLLKGKEGEFAALEALAPELRQTLTPLIEVPSVPYDYANDRPAKSVDEHIASIGDRLRRCWRGLPVFIDLSWLEETETLVDGRVALAKVLADCSAQEVFAVPVVSLSSSPRSLEASEDHALLTSGGLCLRLTVADFEEDVDTEGEVLKLLDHVSRIPADKIDLILDLGDLGPELGRAGLIARSILGMVPKAKEWRRLVLAAASFPEDLRDVDASTVSKIPRREWELWSMLQRHPNRLPRRDLMFGDYGIAHPIPKELDPRTMRMSASIRYTTADSWLVIKGRNVRQYGFEQYFDLCRNLAERSEFAGAAFSWADDYIAKCAQHKVGPGNATTWRKVGTNHHLTLVSRQLSSVGGDS